MARDAVIADWMAYHKDQVQMAIRLGPPECNAVIAGTVAPCSIYCGENTLEYQDFEVGTSLRPANTEYSWGEQVLHSWTATRRPQEQVLQNSLINSST